MKKNNKIENIDKLKIVLFYIYILLFYMFGADVQKIRYSEIILLLFLGLEGLIVIKEKKIRIAKPIIFSFIFSFYCLLSCFWSKNAQLAIDRSKTLFILSIFLLVSYNFFVRIEGAENVILKIVMYAGIVFSIYVILYYGVGEYFNRLMSGERVGMELNNVNTIGLQVSISIIIAIFYALYDNKKIYLLFSIVSLIVALGTGSRKVLILIVVGTIMLFILRKEEKINIINISRKILVFIFVVLFFLYIIQLPMFSTILSRLESMFNIVTGNGKVDSSTEMRERLIESGINQFLKTPIVGIGIGNSGYITMEISGESTYLHNNFVELLATVGIIGFTMYYYIYFYIIRCCLRFMSKKSKYINIVLIIFFINLILEYGMVSYFSKNIYFYILLAMVVIKKEREKCIDEQNNKINKKSEINYHNLDEYGTFQVDE